VRDLIPGDGTILLHSQPREFKTLIAQETALALTTGRLAFGLLETGPAVPVWYITEEDGWQDVGARFGDMLAGAGLRAAPTLLHTSIGEGINLDDLEWQEAIIAQAVACRYRLVIFDPLRSLTAAADQGPRELKPIVAFICRLIREAGCAVFIAHHDTKPTDKPDTRRRPQRASGGGIFSIADAPIHIEAIDTDRRLLVPTAYKFTADPAPITLTLETGEGWMRLVGTPSARTGSAEHAGLDAKILEYLNHSPYSYGSKVAAGVQASKSAVLARLKALETAGAVDSIPEDRGTKWLRARRAP
jgi:AAA domain